MYDEKKTNESAMIQQQLQQSPWYHLLKEIRLKIFYWKVGILYRRRII